MSPSSVFRLARLDRARLLRLAIRMVAFTAILVAPGGALAGTQERWSALRNLSGNPGFSGFPRVAVVGARVHVVWSDDGGWGRQVFYRRSTNGGRIWGDTQQVSGKGASIGGVTIAAAGPLVHVAWSQRALEGESWLVFYSRSKDHGGTWSAAELLVDCQHSYLACYGDIAAQGRYVHFGFGGGGLGPENLYTRSTDGGVSWSQAVPLPGTLGLRHLAVAGSLVHVVWNDARTEIFYNRSSNRGLSWGRAQRLEAGGGSVLPSVAGLGKAVHVVWSHYYPGNSEILHVSSPDGGASWSPTRRLTEPPANSITPQVAVSGNQVHVVWYDERPGANGVYYKVSRDGGRQWSEERQLTSSSGISQPPAIALGLGSVHVVMHASVLGNWEVFYRGTVHARDRPVPRRSR